MEFVQIPIGAKQPEPVVGNLGDRGLVEVLPIFGKRKSSGEVNLFERARGNIATKSVGISVEQLRLFRPQFPTTVRLSQQVGHKPRVRASSKDSSNHFRLRS